MATFSLDLLVLLLLVWTSSMASSSSTVGGQHYDITLCVDSKPLHTCVSLEQLMTMRKNISKTRSMLITGGSSANIPQIQTELGFMTKLQKLVLFDIPAWEFLPNIFWNLSDLRELQIIDAMFNKTAPNLLANATKLHKLHLQHLTEISLQSVKNNILRSITSRDLSSLSIISTGYGTLRTLNAKYLSVAKHWRLKNLILADLGITKVTTGITRYIKHIECVDMSSNLFFTRQPKLVLELYRELLTLNQLRMIVYDHEHAILRPVKFSMNTVINNRCIEKEPQSKSSMRRKHNYKNIRCTLNIMLPKHFETLIVKREQFTIITLSTRVAKLCFTPNILRYIDVSYSTIYITQPAEIYGLTNLEYLNLHSTSLTTLSIGLFGNFPSLEVLILSNNNLGKWFNNKNATAALTAMPNLKRLSLANSHIANISQNDLTNILRVPLIDLTGNDLTELSFNLTITLSFKILNISNNKIRFLPSKFMKSLESIIMHNRKLYFNRSNDNGTKHPYKSINEPIIDLSNNVLECSCKTHTFLLRMMRRKEHFHGYNKYLCLMNNSPIHVTKLNISNMDCSIESPQTQRVAITVGVSLSTLFIIGLISYMTYHYRKTVLYIVYYMPYINMRRFLYRIQRSYKKLDEESEYTYKYLILDSGDELRYVTNIIIPEITQRGFSVASSRINIFTSFRELITSSESVIIIASPDAICGGFEYELTIAIEMRKKIHVVQLEAISSSKIPLPLTYVFRKYGSKRHPRNPEHISEFWGKFLKNEIPLR